CHRSFIGIHNLSYGLIKKGWSRLGCRSIGGSGTAGAEWLDGGSLKGKDNGSVVGGLDGSRSAFSTLNPEITQETVDFFVSDAEGDPDQPSEAFCSIDQAVNALREGKVRITHTIYFVIAVDDDDDDGENEGDLIMAATLANTKAIAFMMKHGSGIVSVGMKEEDLERLMIPMMSSPIAEIKELSAAAATITVDARTTSSGVSAADRAETILALASPDSEPGDFRRPGHVFLLKYRKGGVLKRAGHTEASVDLVTLAGLRPASILSTIIDPEDGSVAGLPTLRTMAKQYDLPIISISDLIRYSSIEAMLSPVFLLNLHQVILPFVPQGDIGDGHNVLVRVHSECLTGDILGSARCDCGDQLDLALQLIEQEGRGVVVYLRGHEGRGIGLGHKLRAYNLQDQGHDTVEANLELGLAVDAREYGIGAQVKLLFFAVFCQILRDIGVRTMRLMTNNPAKFMGLKGYGLAVVGRVPVISPVTEENKRYLETKRTKMGHIYGSDLPGSSPEFLSS
ncbi:hypothetical protein GW17_00054573, partial [Ensete ventricosum]